MCAAGAASAYGQPASVEAMLIHASDRPAPLDIRMEKVEYRLRRIFGFEHYRFMGKTSAIIHPPAQVRLEIHEDYVLHINATSSNDRVRAQVRWMQDRESLLSTSVAQRRGIPVILGGPPHEGGTLILILTFK